MPARPIFKAAIEDVESGGRDYPPDSSAGAIGPRQMMPKTGADLGYTEDQLRVPSINREASDRYIDEVLFPKYNGDEHLMAAAYNSGPGRVDKWLAGRGSLPSETQDYLQKVMGFMNGGQSRMRSPEDAQSHYTAARNRRSMEDLGGALMALQPPQEEAGPSEDLGSTQTPIAGEGKKQQSSMRGGPVSPGNPQLEQGGLQSAELHAGGVINDLISWAHAQGLGTPEKPPTEDELRESVAHATNIAMAAGGVGGEGGGKPSEGAPTELPPEAEVPRYHGSKQPIESLEDYNYSPKNIYGQGLYTTDNPEIAGSKGYKGKNGVVYQTTEKNPVKFLNLEDKPPEGFADKINASNPPVDMDPSKPMREWFDDMRDESGPGTGISADTIQESFEIAREQAENSGYGGWQHVGGKVTGGQEHNVKVYFNPQRDLNITPYEPPPEAEVPQGAAAAPAAPSAEAPPGQPPGAPPPAEAPPLGAGEIPHKVKVMQAAAQASPMDDATFNSIETIGEGEHTLIKQPIDPVDLLRMHYHGVDKGLEWFDARDAAAATGSPGDMVHAALLTNEFAETVAPRWAAAWHQFGLGMRLGRELKPDSDFMRDLTGLMQENNDIGGLLSATAKLKTPGQRAELLTQAAAGGRPSLANNLLNYYVESLLSFNTVAKKAVTDLWMAGWQIPERFGAEQISRVARALGADPKTTVAPGEADHLIIGAQNGAAQAWRLAKQALKEDKSPLDPAIWGPVGWGDASRNAPNIAAGTVLEDTPVGAAFDLMGQFVHLPSRGILSTDTYAKAMNFEMNYTALAYRKAYWEATAKGLEDDALSTSVQARQAELMTKRPPALVQQAIEASKTNTLAKALDLHPPVGEGMETSPWNRWTLGRAAQAVQNARQTSALARVMLPFWPTLVNLARQSLEFGGPLGVLSRSMRDDLVSATPARYIAMSKMGLSSLLMWGLHRYLHGSAPASPAIKELWHEEGNQEYSLGTENYAIGNLPEPISGAVETMAEGQEQRIIPQTLKTLADIKELSGRVSAQDAEKLGTAAVVLISKQLDDSSSLQNLMSVLTLAQAGKEEYDRLVAEGNMASEMTPEQQQAQESVDEMQRGSPAQKAGRALRKMAGTVVPSSVANLAHGIDPVRRQVNDIVDEVASRTPGWSKYLDPEVNLFGKPALQPLGWNRYIGNQISLFRNTEIKHDNVIHELTKLNINAPMIGYDGMVTAGDRGAFEKIPITPQQVTQVNRYRGTLVDPDSHKDLYGELKEYIESQDYLEDAAPDRRTNIMRTIGKFSRMAIDKLTDENKDLQAQYQTIRDTREKMRGSPGAALGAP